MKTLRISAAAVLCAASLAAVATPPPRSGAADAIVGVWEFQVNLVSCDTGQTVRRLRAATLFNAGGTLLDTNVAPPSTRGPAFGVWRYEPRSRRYEIDKRFYRYNPDGSFAGVTQIHRSLALDDEGDGMTGTIRTEFLGPNEELQSIGCGTETGTRALD